MEPEKPKSVVPRIVQLLHDDLVRAYHDLSEYKLIYTEDQEQIDLLNATGQLFFVRLHHLYWANFVSTTARFLDPAKTRAQENLSFYQLMPLAETLPFKGPLLEKLAQAKDEATPALTARHKFVGHRDLKQSLVADEKPLRVQLRTIESVYDRLGDCLGLFYSHFEKIQTDFKPWISQPAAKSLISYLRKGHEAFDLERRQMLERFQKN